MGERSISPMGHVRMMAATQPFISGAISKTVNMPETATVEEVADVYYQGWKLGPEGARDLPRQLQGRPAADRCAGQEGGVAVAAPASHAWFVGGCRASAPSQTVSFSVAGAEGYMTAGSYPDDGLGEVFLKLGKQGSTLAGVMDAFSIAISIALQYGVPLETYVQKFTNMRFEPAGMTDDPDIRMAQSVMDYIFRRLALDYLPFETRAELGIFTAEERAATVAATSTARRRSSTRPETMTSRSTVETMRGSVPVEAAQRRAGRHRARCTVVDRAASRRQQGTAADAPLCLSCGVKMRPAGSLLRLRVLRKHQRLQLSGGARPAGLGRSAGLAPNRCSEWRAGTCRASGPG